MICSTNDPNDRFRRVDEPTSKRGGPVSPWLLATVALAVLLGVFFRAYGLDHKVFWGDEIDGVLRMQGYTEAEVVEASPRLVNAAAVQRYLRAPSPDEHRPLAATIRALAIEDPLHPPLYYLAGRLWEQVFGSSAAAIRSLSAVFGVLALPCLYWFCLELFGSSETALVAVALVAVSPFYVLYAQEAREYSLWTLVILLDALLFMRASRSTAPAPWIAYAALTALGLYVYPLTGLVALGFGAYLLVRERCRLTTAVIAWTVATLAALGSFVPWLAASSRGFARGMSWEKLSPATIALVFLRDLRLPFFDLGSFRIGGLSSTPVNLLLTVVAAALCTYALAVLIRDRPFEVWGFIVIALCLPMMALPLIDLFVRGDFVYQARYFIPLLLGLQLSVAALFAAAILGKAAGGGARRAWLALFAFVMAGEVLSCAVGAGADTWWNKDYERSRSVAEIVNRSPKPIVISDYFAQSILDLSFYLDPGVPLRLNLKCVLCVDIPTVHSNLARDAGGYDTVFMLQLADAPNEGRYRWINPVPHPARPDQLNMFLSI